MDMGHEPQHLKVKSGDRITIEIDGRQPVEVEVIGGEEESPIRRLFNILMTVLIGIPLLLLAFAGIVYLIIRLINAIAGSVE